MRTIFLLVAQLYEARFNKNYELADSIKNALQIADIEFRIQKNGDIYLQLHHLGMDFTSETYELYKEVYK